MNTNIFHRQCRIETTPRSLFDWHAREGAFERLSPPWEKVRILDQSGTIRDGDTINLELRMGPVPLRWRARHEAYVDGSQFVDRQEGGPFSQWVHTHKMQSDDGGSVLDDSIAYRLPLAPVSTVFAGPMVRSKLDRLFTYRHRTTRDDLVDHARYESRPRLVVGITGSSGLIGRVLSAFLTTGGHTVRPIARTGSGKDLVWETEHLKDLDAVVHLAGESVDGRWTARKKHAILESRILGTERLVAALRSVKDKPSVLVSASAVGYYGDQGDDVLTEDSDPGNGFLADVCKQWERAAREGERSGMRVVPARLGVVLSGVGGALKKMLPPFKMGMGGRIGSGDQVMSWIAIDDVIGGIHHIIQEDSITGPVNLVSPGPQTNLNFTKTLGRVLSRPTIAPLPMFAAKLVFGEMAEALLLASARCLPGQLADSGYGFRYADLEDALRFQLGRMPAIE